MRIIRHAPFALRVVDRKEGKAAIVYRRKSDKDGRDRLQRLSSFSTLAYTAGAPLLRDAVSKSVVEVPNSRRNGTPTDGQEGGRSRNVALSTGRFYPLDANWGAKVACFAYIASGLGNAERLMKAASQLRSADANEAAWWLGMLTRDDNVRALRALRILTEAVE